MLSPKNLVEQFKMYLNLLKVIFLQILFFASCYSYTPIVLWHGITETCCADTVTGNLQKNLTKYLPGVHVRSIRIGNSAVVDYLTSIFMHPNKQVEIACNIIKSDPLLANGYNAVGYSQGAQLMRAVAQRCPEPKMKTLVSLAGQHQGIYGIPYCNPSVLSCNILRRMGNKYVYMDIAQKLFAPSTYWQNPLNRTAYLEGSTFLAEINNEKTINESYIENLKALENFVMIKYEADETIIPLESEWFGFYKPGQSRVVQSLRETDLYINDRLGLKQMDEDKKLHFLTTSWVHKEFDWTWFTENIVDKFFA